MTNEHDIRLGEMKDQLMHYFQDVFEAWRSLETECEVFARAKLYMSFPQGIVLRSIIGSGRN